MTAPQPQEGRRQTAHTPEPWKKEYVGAPFSDMPGWHLYDTTEIKRPIGVIPEPIGGRKDKHGRSPYQTANASRIVACVNGCAGLTEEEIRAAVSQFKVAKASGSLAGRKQQDAAYRQVVDVLKTILPYLHEEEPVVKKARVALAAGQGEHT